MKLEKIYHRIASTIDLFNPLPLNKGSRILMFHAIGNQVQEDPQGVWTLSAEQFEKIIQHLYSQKIYRFASIQEPIDSSSPSLIISFDDGYKNNWTIARPILEKYQIPFCIFLNGKFIKEKHPDFVSEQDIQEMVKHPLITLGSHGWTHQNLSQLPLDQAQKDLEYAHHYLTQTMGAPCQYFSYPHGGYSPSLAQHLEKLGYKKALCSYLGINDEKTDSFSLRRFPIMAHDTLHTIDLKMAGAYNWLFLKQKLFRP